MNRRLISADRLVDGNVDGPAWLEVVGSTIVARGEGHPEKPADVKLQTVLPPFVDIHTHGACGVDLGAPGVDPTPAIDYHRRNGSTVIQATIATGPTRATEQRIKELTCFVDAGQLEGVHLEGPWLSDRYRGAHDPRLLQSPELDGVQALTDAGGGTVRMVTIAPELPGVLPVIRWLTEQGVVVALGHSAADATTVRRAVDAGATVVTHLFNGMAPLHHREVGLAGVGLIDPRLWVELIGDGVHVCDDAVDLVRLAAGKRLVLVSDAMAAAGLGDGSYLLAGSRVQVSGGTARLADSDQLAGSTTVIRGAAERLLARGAEYRDVVAWTNTHPAGALGFNPPGLRVGDQADLVELSHGRVARVMWRGAWLG